MNYSEVHKPALSQSKKIIFTLSMAVIAIALISFTTLALLQTSKTVTNTVVPGQVDIETVNNFAAGTLQPGSIPLTKEVAITNVIGAGHVEAFIKVRLLPIWRNSDGTSGSGLPTNDITIQLASGWMTNWFYVPNVAVPSGTSTENIPQATNYDGVFYYRWSIDPGQTTSLLTSAVIWTNPQLPADHIGKVFELQVLAEGIQTGIPATPPSGYPATVKWPWTDTVVSGNTLAPA